MTSSRTVLFGGVCAVAMIQALVSPVQAQTTAPAVAAEEPSIEREIIVTGSRIARRDFTAESPIATVSEEFIQNSGPATIENALNALPQLQASQGAQTSGATTGGAGTSGGRANANLRGLGPARTLVLFDGRRLQPSDPLGGIDLNTISPALVSTVETITGGASAIYGSDAVAGVINFRFNSAFRGFRIDVDTGITEKGDGENISTALTWGGAFNDDRGRAFLSLSYFNRGTVSRDAREFYRAREGSISFVNGLVVVDGANPFGFGAPASVAAYRDLFTRTYGTSVPVASSSLVVNSDGTIFGRTGGQNLRNRPGDNFVLNNGAVTRLSAFDATLQVPLTRYTAFARAEYELADWLTAYGQVIYTNYRTDQLQDAGIFQSITGTTLVRPDNPFVTADLRVALNARPFPNRPFQYYFDGARVGRLRIINEYDVSQYLIGARGEIPGSDWTWDVYGTFGETRQNEIAQNQISRSAFDQLINNVNAAGIADGGTSLCEGGYPLFGFQPVSESCRRFLALNSTNRYRFTQKVFQANLTGALFTLPGGDAKLAAGFEYRSNEFTADIDSVNQQRQATVNGITTFYQPEALGIAGSSSGAGSASVKEGYVEVLLPILSDAPFAHSLEIDLAYRYSDYNTIGGVHTYKAGASWSPLRGAAIRGGYSRAIRAPGIGELYAPRQGLAGAVGSVASGLGDPCDVTGNARTGKISGVDPARVRALCLAQGVPASVIDSYRYSGTAVSAYRVGNTALREETADSYTIGLVLQPKFGTDLLRNVSLSIDYYSIKLNDAVGRVTTSVALQQCFNANGQNPEYANTDFNCQLINRDAAGLLSFINEPLFNLGAYSTRGIDFQLDTRSELGNVGTLGINSIVSYVLDYKIKTLPTSPTLDYAGTIGNGQIDGFTIAHPSLKATTTLTYARPEGSLSLRWRYIDKMSNSANVGVSGGTAQGVPAVSYFDLIGRLVASETMEFRLGVTNLLDKQPPTFGGPAQTDLSTYDVIGRRFFLGATKRF